MLISYIKFKLQFCIMFATSSQIKIQFLMVHNSESYSMSTKTLFKIFGNFSSNFLNCWSWFFKMGPVHKWALNGKTLLNLCCLKLRLRASQPPGTLSPHKPKVHCTASCHLQGTQTAIKRHASALCNKRNSSRTGSKTWFWLSFVLGRENFSL